MSHAALAVPRSPCRQGPARPRGRAPRGRAPRGRAPRGRSGGSLHLRTASV